MPNLWLHVRAEWEGLIFVNGFKDKFVSVRTKWIKTFLDDMGEV